MNKIYFDKAFTVVELLVVVVVIGIIASITIVSYASVQDRSKGTVIGNDAVALKKALKSYASDEQITSWWSHSAGSFYTGSPSPPSIQNIIDNTNLKDYFESFSSTTTSNTTSITYNNAGGTYGGCSTTLAGVNILFNGVSSKIAASIDSAIDDGNTGCGSITYSGTQLRYNISTTNAIQ